jgi:amino acid transporter
LTVDAATSQQEESVTTDQGGHERGLRANAIGLGGDVIVAVANVAPSSAVAFTLALLLTLTGLASPLVVVIVGALMLCVTLGYAAMNRWRPSAGAPYVWVGEATTPVAGIGTGLMQALGATLFNIGNITLAGAYLLFVVSPSSTFPKAVTWLIAAAIMGVLLWISIRGLRPSVWVQTGLIVIEYASVISFVILALIHEASGAGGASLPSIHDFSFASNIGGIRGLANAGVTCAVLYAGWEAVAVVGEESTKSRQNPGRAMIASVAFLLIWFTGLIMVFQSIASQKTLLAHGGDVLAYAGQLVAPGLAGRILPLAVLIAVIGTTQLQMTEASRILYAFARDRLLPGFLGKINANHGTPWAALTVLGLIPPIFLIPYLASSSFFTIITNIISSGGELYLFLYFVVAVSSVWFFRSQLRQSGRTMLVGGILPLLGGLLMLVLCVYGMTTEKGVVTGVALGIIALCYLVAFIIVRVVRDSPFLDELQRRRAAGISGPDAEPAPAADVKGAADA